MFQVRRGLFSIPLRTVNNTKTQENVSVSTGTESVFEKLSKLNPNSVHRPDGIPSWLLNENTDLLVGPFTDILHFSYREGGLPQAWKEADIVAIPKQKPIQDVNNNLCPISLTPILSKLEEDFVVDINLKPAVMEKIDKRQFGSLAPHTHSLACFTLGRKTQPGKDPLPGWRCSILGWPLT